MVETAELQFNLNRVATGCPKCGFFFLFELNQGDQKCPECGSLLKWTKVVKSLKAYLDNPKERR